MIDRWFLAYNTFGLLAFILLMNGEPFPLRIHATMSWWFWVLLTMGFAAGASFLVRWRIDKKRKEEYLKAEFDKKLASVEMHALRAQMNPHFIFNCLNSIDYYILKSETENASEYLNRFSRLIRLILQNSRSKSVNLRDELDALRLYIEMESLRFDRQFDYEVKVDKDLNLEEVTIPPMILQPYVENAIWHGLMQKKGRRRLELIITRENSHLYCVIQDNGIGREAAMALRSKSAGRRKSMGMQITSDRIGMISKDAIVRVEDLRDPEGVPSGTRVELEIPL